MGATEKRGIWSLPVVFLAIAFQNCTPSFESLGGKTSPTTPANLTSSRTQQADTLDHGASIDAERLFPDVSVLLPPGASYPDRVPDTIDLAERASRYIAGVTATAHPGLRYVPVAATLNSKFTYAEPGPALDVPWGAPNWGEVMLAIGQARKMTAFDRDNAQGTVGIQLEMMKSMLDKDVDQALGTHIVNPNEYITPSTYAMQALMGVYEHRPSPELRAAIDLFVRTHRGLQTDYADAGRIFRPFHGSLTTIGADLQIGYMGPSWAPFIQGAAQVGMEDWYRMTGDPTARQIADDMGEYLRNVNGSSLWVSPAGSGFSFAPTKGFAGHMYSFLEALHGIVLQAKALQSSSPQAASVLAAFVRDQYEFVKRRTNAGYVGNFGSSGTAADMIVIGLALADMGAGDYYDEIDAWTRNQLTECEIDQRGSEYIPNESSADWAKDHVGLKVKGLFFADATHIRSIPSLSQAFTTDDHAMAFRGIHDVWSNTAKIKGPAAYVNFHMNYAGPILDVKSDVPYRGRITVRTKSALNGVTDLYLHIPVGTDRSRISLSGFSAEGTNVTVNAKVSDGPYQNYVHVGGLQPNTSYVMNYPLFVWDAGLYEMRSERQGWYEGSFPANPADETVIAFNGHFRGGTLVRIDAGPTEGIPRYAETWRRSLADLGAAEVDAPTNVVTRFVYGGDQNGLPRPSSVISHLSWSFAGPLAGKSCTQINEPSDPDTWDDNYLCSDVDYGLKWSYAGPIDGMKCVQFLEPADSHTWSDNFLCAPQDLGLQWSFAGPIAGQRCLQILEPSDADTWGHNFLCGVD